MILVNSCYFHRTELTQQTDDRFLKSNGTLFTRAVNDIIYLWFIYFSFQYFCGRNKTNKSDTSIFLSAVKNESNLTNVTHVC